MELRMPCHNRNFLYPQKQGKVAIGHDNLARSIHTCRFLAGIVPYKA
jgi:hypothetical protein